MTKDDFLRANRTRLSDQTRYERRYVDEVLARVPGLRWEAVQAQTPFVDADGVRRRIDFTIIEGEAVKIAIEVDGYDKTGRGHGMTRAEFADWSRREQAIVAAGYRLIRVANRLVNREPEACARTVELVLKRERQLAARIAQLPAAAQSDLNAARKQHIGEMLTDAERAELDQLAESHKAAIDALEQQLQDEIERRQGAEAAHDRAERDRTGMVTLARAFAVGTVAIAVTVAVAALALTRDDDDANARAASAGCAEAASWTEAERLRGSQATLRGPVAAATYQSGTRGRPTFIDVGAPYPDRGRLVAVVWGADRDTFPDAPERLYRGQSIAVSGQVTNFRGLSQIEVSQPAQISIC